mmetsp:Transcript_7814/g.16096  ORF Transcript_7814/g.16096 Transcript_7814/m.16096 type:complete len:231 (-) Transcript_7814:1608-2300(-)
MTMITILFSLIILLPISSLLIEQSPSTRLRATESTRTPTSISLATESKNDGAESMPSAALFENIKAFDDNLARGNLVGGYSESIWSNRLGTALTPVANSVYTGDRPFYWNKIDVGGRMCVIQLDGGDLWVHSPVELDRETKNMLKKLGTVKYIISPNYEHLKYAEQWSNEYPDAYMWGCPGLSKKLPDIKWEGEIPFGIMRPSESDDLKNCWDFDIIVPLHLNMEVHKSL